MKAVAATTRGICVALKEQQISTTENKKRWLFSHMHISSFTACGAGESVYLDPNSQKPWSCNIALQDSCPPGFGCKIDTLTNKYVCCGSADMGNTQFYLLRAF